jgi:hypothetical protein
MKERFKNWITSVIGIAIMLSACVWKFIPVMAEKVNYEASTLDFVLLLFVGWVFLSAKDSLIEGVLGGLVKLKNTGNSVGGSENEKKKSSEVG